MESYPSGCRSESTHATYKWRNCAMKMVLQKKPDIVSYIRVAMEYLSQYIISQTQKRGSAVMEQQKKKQGDGEAVEKREDQHEDQAMIITPKGAATAVGEIGARKRRNDHHHQMLCWQAMEVINGRDQVTRQL